MKVKDLKPGMILNYAYRGDFKWWIVAKVKKHDSENVAITWFIYNGVLSAPPSIMNLENNFDNNRYEILNKEDQWQQT